MTGITWNLLPAAELDSLAETWNALNADGPRTPMLDARFVAAGLDHFGGGGERIAVAGDRAGPAALAVVAPQSRASWATLQPAQAPLGAFICGAQADLPGLAAGLLRALPSFPLVLGITQQDPDLLPRPPAGGGLRTLDYIDTARVSITGTFDDYWSARGKNLRHNVKRQRNRLEREGVVTRLETVTAPEAMAEAVASYGELETRGWKGEQGTAIAADNAQGRFYIDMLSRFAATGQARVYRYWYDDRLAAVDLCVTGHGTLVILKTTFDESITTSSPAMQMRYDAFREIFAAGELERIEFYGRVMDWHTKWSSEIRTMYHVNQYRWELLAKLRERGGS